MKESRRNKFPFSRARYIIIIIISAPDEIVSICFQQISQICLLTTNCVLAQPFMLKNSKALDGLARMVDGNRAQQQQQQLN